MKVVEGWAKAVDLKRIKVFSAKGPPQWRRKVSTVDFPLRSWEASLGVDGALEATRGAKETDTGEGESQDASSCWKVIVRLSLMLAFATPI